MNKIKIIGSIVLLLFLINPTLSQENHLKKKVFLNGRVIDFNYIRNQITMVDFVNDSHSANVHIIVTEISTGSGGEQYFIHFNTLNGSAIPSFKIQLYTSANASHEEKRQLFLQSLKSGLLVYANEYDLVYNVETMAAINVNTNSSEGNTAPDKWKNWVFSIGFAGGVQAEEQKQIYEYETELNANRITPKWRIRNEYQFQRQDTRIVKIVESGNEIIKALNQEQDFESRLAYAISSHWSAGIFIESQQNTYRNTAFNLNVNPIVEYNFFTWEQVDEHQLTVSYTIGPNWFKYYTPTIFEKTTEFKWGQNLKIDMEKVATWGTLELWLEGNSFIPDFNFFRVETGIRTAINIAKGLSLELNFQHESINNQLYLPASELSDEELLLDLRKLPSTFELSGQIGIVYQFGSIYNNVVNERM
ncbi:MAG: hypothetical protein PF541_09550 [Prolixibacteraceae bacterium]|jgi:hypothetical protein|nr:hypothetical protein [Prolixibacteraceae bacterium]